MSRKGVTYNNYYSHTSRHKPRRRYGFFGFIFDVSMCLLTGGLWLIWIFVREMRHR